MRRHGYRRAINARESFRGCAGPTSAVPLAPLIGGKSRIARRHAARHDCGGSLGRSPTGRLRPTAFRKKLLLAWMPLLIRVWFDLVQQIGQRIRDRNLPHVVVIGAQSVPEKYSHLTVQRGFALRRRFVGGKGVVRRHGPPFLFSVALRARPGGATLIAQPGGCDVLVC
jgi:hypothetical protein